VNVGRLSNEEAKTMLIKKQQQLEVVLTGMKIDDNQKRAIVQSMTQILTSIIGSGTKLVTESMDKRD
jgi:hydroxyethylthiazole kinase-like sugar kinase family protein